MSKHKKTRKEKIIADYRHQVYVLKNNNTPLNKPVIEIPIKENSNLNIHTLRDLLKTGVLTCTIVVAQIALFFLLKKHILLIPNLNY